MRGMRIGDGVVALLVMGVAAFFLLPQTRQLYEHAYAHAPVLLSFLKFALLATGGEIVAMRLRTGNYQTKGFGVFPKTVIWGLLGITIYWAFIIFASGTPNLFPVLKTLPDPWNRLAVAFVISFFMNIIYAPPMMLTHHLTDRFIADHGGRFPVSRLDVLTLVKRIDWEKMWGFVFKKTIPLFWIPAHTITFLLPEQFRVLFAATLSLILGLILGSVRRKAE